MEKRKLLPPFTMLSAGAVAIILLAIGKYDIKTLLSTLLLVLIVFYLLGCGMAFLLAHFEKQNEKDSLDEGEVIEKQTGENIENVQE